MGKIDTTDYSTLQRVPRRLSKERNHKRKFGRQAPHAGRKFEQLDDMKSSDVLSRSYGRQASRGTFSKSFPLSIARAASREISQAPQTGALQFGAPVQMGRPQMGAPTIGAPVQMGRPQPASQPQVDLDQLLTLPRQQVLATLKSNPAIVQQMIATLQQLSQTAPSQ